MADGKVQTAGVSIVGKPKKTGEAQSKKNSVVDRACRNPLFQAQLTQIAADPKAVKTFKALANSRKEHYTNTGNSVLMDIMSAITYKLEILSEDLSSQERVQSNHAKLGKDTTTSPIASANPFYLGNDNIFTSLA